VEYFFDLSLYFPKVIGIKNKEALNN
jgi:hypothetical protein